MNSHFPHSLSFQKIQLLKIILFFSFLFLGFSSNLFAQQIGDYRTKISGDWNGTTTWQKWDGDSWENETTPPTSGTSEVTRNISILHLTNITSSISIENVNISIQSTASLRLVSQVNLNFNTNATLTLAGTNVNPIVKTNQGNIVIKFNEGSVCDIITSSNPAIPSADTWHINSRLKLRNNIATAITYSGLNQLFGFVEFDRNLNSGVNQTFSLGNVYNTLKVTNTGLGTLGFSGAESI